MTLRVLIALGLLAGALHGAAAAQQLPPEIVKYADVIVTNAVIYSADEKFTKHEAMAVRDGRILAVGTSDHITRLAGPNTERIDMKGRPHSIIPGLFESHGHGPMGTGGGLEGRPDAKRGSVEFPSIPEGLKLVAEQAKGVPAGRWIVLGGPRDARELQKVTRWELDTVTPDNPLCITYGGELSVVNSKAWELGELTDSTPGVVKNEKGQGTGQLRTWAHGQLSYKIPWAPVGQEDVDDRKRVFMEANAEGITTIVGRMMGRAITVLQRMWELDALTVRTRISLGFLRSNPEPEAYLKRIGKLVGFGLGDMVKIIGLTTQHADGTSGSGAMLTRKPKLRQLEGDPYGPYGENRWESEENDSINVQLAIKYGWNVSGVHNQGDQANFLFLKAIEAGSGQAQLVPVTRPHGTDHNTLNSTENLALMKKFNVRPSVGLYLGEESLIYQYGADEANRTSAFKTMIDTGLRPASEEARPALSAIERMITREGEDGKTWGKDQALTKQQALFARTLWSAEYAGEDKDLGSLEAGKFADFVVLGADYMQTPDAQIAEIPVLMTYLSGKKVYDRERDGVPQPRRRQSVD
jgi:predicted amidohydrolase YtcJ